MSSSTGNKTKILSDETVYQAKYFRVRKITIERNGKTFTKDFIERAPAVLIIPYTKGGDIYVEYQYRDALNKSVYELVAGNMEDDADPLETAKRELKEETGLVAKTWHKIAAWDLSVNMMAKIHVFAATELTEGKSDLNDDEVIDTIKMPFSDVLEKIENGDIPAASHIAALLVFEKLKKEGKL